jgi:hypothetical protein
MTTGLRNSAESVAKRVAKLTSGVSSKLDRTKTIDRGTRMDIAYRVKNMKEIVDGFDKFSSKRLKGLEERDKKRKEKRTPRRARPRANPTPPSGAHGRNPAYLRPRSPLGPLRPMRKHPCSCQRSPQRRSNTRRPEHRLDRLSSSYPET